MNHYFKILAHCALAFAAFSAGSAALAHRSGCHRWHSCPSDTGSYVCGDTGNKSECGASQVASAPKKSAPPSRPKQKTPPADPKPTVANPF